MLNKKFIFAGDSFTWGQGLQYYGEFNDIKIMPSNHYVKEFLTDEHVDFIKKNRYSKIVANHLNKVDIVKDENGGSDFESIEFIKNNIDENVEYVLLQTTQPFRSPYRYFYKGEEKWLDGSNLHDNNHKLKEFKEYLIEEKINIDDWLYDLKKQIVLNIKDLAIYLDNRNIKFNIISWTNDYLNLIKNDELLSKKFLNLEYGGYTFSCFDTLFSMYPYMTIHKDHEFFGEGKTMPDHHMGLTGHKTIADIILKNITS